MHGDIWPVLVVRGLTLQPVEAPDLITAPPRPTLP